VSTPPPAEEVVLYDKDPTTKIATITLARPDRLNAPTVAARLRYAELLHRANIDDDVKVLIVRGIGDDFGSSTNGGPRCSTKSWHHPSQPPTPRKPLSGSCAAFSIPDQPSIR